MGSNLSMHQKDAVDITTVDGNKTTWNYAYEGRKLTMTRENDQIVATRQSTKTGHIVQISSQPNGFDLVGNRCSTKFSFRDPNIKFDTKKMQINTNNRSMILGNTQLTDDISTLTIETGIDTQDQRHIHVFDGYANQICHNGNCKSYEDLYKDIDVTCKHILIEGINASCIDHSTN